MLLLELTGNKQVQLSHCTTIQLGRLENVFLLVCTDYLNINLNKRDQVMN